MEKYKKYKDSGIEWIGDIPEHWDIKRLKYIGDSVIGITYSPKEIAQKEGTLVLRSSNIQKGKLSLKDTVFINKEIPEKLVARKGDILICSRNGSRRLIGKNITIDKRTDGETFGAFMTVFRTEQYKFISKYFNSQVFSGQSGLFLTATINQLTINTLNNFYTALPPKEEQTKIANYLDQKTSEIDQLISQKEELLQFYDEEKTAIINQAVTKGINPNVNLKDSGVDWLGEIPVHWEVKRLSYCFNNIGSGTTPKSGNQDYYFNGEFNWLQTGDLNNGEINKTSKKITQKALDRHSTLRFYPSGSVVIAMYGATIGKMGLLNIKTTTNQACCVLAEPNGVLVKFVFYWFLSMNKHIISMGYGGGQPNINQEQVRSLKIQLPKPDEQTQIVNHIETEIKKINTKVDKTKKLIELLKEYKIALISEVVTGKIKI